MFEKLRTKLIILGALVTGGLVVFWTTQGSNVIAGGHN